MHLLIMASPAGPVVDSFMSRGGAVLVLVIGIVLIIRGRRG